MHQIHVLASRDGSVSYVSGMVDGWDIGAIAAITAPLQQNIRMVAHPVANHPFGPVLSSMPRSDADLWRWNVTVKTVRGVNSRARQLDRASILWPVTIILGLLPERYTNHLLNHAAIEDTSP
jgi:hypothetical protein